MAPSHFTHTSYRGRFAPSPTGPLHAGSMIAALGSWLLARHAQGQWLVRIENVDTPREVPGAAEAQLRTLAACGLVSDLPPLRQSENHDRYQAALEHLIKSGHVFACSCSRSELAAQGGVHRRCVATQSRPQPAFRLRVADGSRVAFEDGLQGRYEQDVDQHVGDFVLRRADGYWAYQLAVVVDDAEQGITHVVRGADLLDSTPRQILLQRALGLPSPAYLHLPLLVDAHGHKLSKSSAALPVDEGQPLLALRNAWLGLGQDLAPIQGAKTPDALLQCALSHFDEARLPMRLHFHGATSTTASLDS